jgi:uncharacterized protein YbbC (DUF1343 family)
VKIFKETKTAFKILHSTKTEYKKKKNDGQKLRQKRSNMVLNKLSGVKFIRNIFVKRPLTSEKTVK